LQIGPKKGGLELLKNRQGMVKIPTYAPEMLFPDYYQPYQQFKQDVETLRNDLRSDAEADRLKLAIAALQNYFQTQIWTLDLHSLGSTVEHQVQSIQVEIDKQLRLINMDALFLQAARQETTRIQRRQQIDQRLHLLLQYCNAVLDQK
jgi:hypothetical protein